MPGLGLAPAAEDETAKREAETERPDGEGTDRDRLAPDREAVPPAERLGLLHRQLFAATAFAHGAARPQAEIEVIEDLRTLGHRSRVYSLARVMSRALHVSDLHAGRRETPSLQEALAALAAEVRPEVLLATGDLAHRGRRSEFEAAKRVFEATDIPFLAIPGNHDLPYTFPARFTRPWTEWERSVGPTDPTYRSETLVVVGLNSARPWRQQSGRLVPKRIERAAAELRSAPVGALRVVACHHHLVGSPWRAARKRPLAARDTVLAGLVAAGAELVVGGHIHQGGIALRHEFEALDGAATGGIVLATAPGLGRPRPHRSGEAQGLLLYEWDRSELAVVTYVWEQGRFIPVARRQFPRANPSRQEDESP
jgi:predicted MPP superfamily phosphohydrolase